MSLFCMFIKLKGQSFNAHQIIAYPFEDTLNQIQQLSMKIMKMTKMLLTLTILYSTCSKALNWAQLKNVLATSNITSLSRTPTLEQTYQQFRLGLNDRNLTVPQHVRQNIFGFKGRPKEPMHFLTTKNLNDIPMKVYVTGVRDIWGEFINKSIQGTEVMSIQENSNFILFAINDFPYSLVNINHWVVWSSLQMHPSTQQTLLLEIIDPQVEMLYYQNPPANKSIPEINHFQLFWRKRSVIVDQL